MKALFSLCCSALGEAALMGYRVLRLRGERAAIRAERCGGGAWSSIYRALGAEVTPRPRIWLHCASVGEVRGIVPLLEELKLRADVIATVCTMTGRREMSKHLRHVGLLPFDAPSLLRRHLNAVQVDLLLINETELWPNLLAVAAEQGLPVLLVNGRISDRSFPRYRRILGLCRVMLSQIQMVAAQTERDAERFRALGANEQRLCVIGSTKYDVPVSVLPEGERQRRRAAIGLDSEAPCLIAASVREGEYQQVLEAFSAARALLPELQLIIAPRHPEYFEAVADAIRQRAWKFHLRSRPEHVPDLRQIVLVDTIGELHQLFPLADIAFIGGTLVPIGGHNPLEAAAAGLPVCFGPSTENVRELARELCEAGAAFTVADADELAALLARVLRDSDAHGSACRASLAVCASHRGAVSRILAILDDMLPSSIEGEPAKRRIRRC